MVKAECQLVDILCNLEQIYPPIFFDIMIHWLSTYLKRILKASIFHTGGCIYLKEDDHDVIHFNNSSDLTLSTSLNDLDFVTLNIDGQLMNVKAPPDIIHVDKDDDFINDEDGAPHDFVDSDGEVLTNDDDDMSTLVARVHGDDDGGDDPSGPSPCLIRIGVGGQKPNRGASNHDLSRTSSMMRRISMLTIGLTLSKLPEPFKMLKTRQRARSSASRDLSHLLSFEISKWRALRLESTCPSSRPSSTHILMAANLHRMRREFNRNVISNNETRYTHTDINVNEVKEDNKQLRKELTMLRTVIRSDEWMSQLLTQLESQHKVDGGSGSGEGGDDEPGADEDVNEDEESYDMLYMVSRSGSLVWQGSAINHVLQTLIPIRGRSLVHRRFVTSVLLLPGRANAGQRSGKTIIRHQVPQSSISITCDVIACVSPTAQYHHYLVLLILIVDSEVMATYSLKGWNDHFFWVDTFACPALFSWHTGKSVSKDVVPKSFEFNSEHYATLVAYPTSFHKIGERERDEDEPKLLEATIGRVVLLLSVAPDRSSGELEASVDKLFDEGGSGEQADQGDSISGGHGEPAIGGKSQSAIQRLLTRVVQHAEVRGGVMPTFPFVSSSFSTTSEHSSDHSSVNIAKAEVDSIVRTFIPIMTSATTVTPTVDPATISKKRHIGSSVFGGDSSSASGSHPLSGGFSDGTGNNFLVGGIRTVVDPDSNLYKVYVSQWNVTNRFCMDDAGVYREMEKRRLKSVVEEKDSLLKSKCDEIEILKAQMIVKEAEAAETVHSRDEAKALRESNATLEKDKNELGGKVTDLVASVKEKVTVYEDCMSQLEKFQDEKLEEVNEKFDKLCVDFVKMALHLEEKFYPHLLTTIFGRRCLLTHSMELAIIKCLNSTEYLSVLGAAISKAVEKGMLEGLSARITHGAEGRKLADLKSSKDASVDTIMNLLRLDDTLAERLSLTESQPHVNQLMVPIHYSSDQRVISAFAVSLSLDVSHSRVRRIRENIANHVSALRGVFVPLSEPLSIAALEGMEGTFGSAYNTTTALSVTFVSASTLPPNSTDDYEVAHADGQEGVVVGGEAIANEKIDLFLMLATQS
nr:hypothetical protein [Tanacetum cinerariifolium]